jgi:F-type H+-transporting ATPase subunit b
MSLTLITATTMEPRLFDLDFQLLHDAFLSIIAVFFLVLVLSKVLFNPARKMLEDRKEKIKAELDTAEADMKEANELKGEYEEKLQNIDTQAEDILSDARRKALDNEARIVQEAKEESQRIMEHTKTEVELEKKKMADDVKKQMIFVATAMAGKVVSASIDQETQDALLEDTLKDIGDKTWQN